MTLMWFLMLFSIYEMCVGHVVLMMNIPIFILILKELFVEMIAKDALVYAQQGKRKTLQRKDLGTSKSFKKIDF